MCVISDGEVPRFVPTLRPGPRASDEDFERDARAMVGDLATAKARLGNPTPKHARAADGAVIHAVTGCETALRATAP